MRRLAAGLLLLALVGCGGAGAPGAIQPAPIGAVLVISNESATSFDVPAFCAAQNKQIAGEFHADWGILATCAASGTGYGTVHLVDSLPQTSTGSGYHQGNQAYILMSGKIATLPHSLAISHEVLEMLADPDGKGYEVCDPVAFRQYTIDGVSLSDYVTRNYFVGGPGPWDHMGAVTGPNTPNMGP